MKNNNPAIGLARAMPNVASVRIFPNGHLPRVVVRPKEHGERLWRRSSRGKRRSSTSIGGATRPRSECEVHLRRMLACMAWIEFAKSKEYDDSVRLTAWLLKAKARGAPGDLSTAPGQIPQVCTIQLPIQTCDCRLVRGRWRTCEGMCDAGRAFSAAQPIAPWRSFEIQKLRTASHSPTSSPSASTKHVSQV